MANDIFSLMNSLPVVDFKSQYLYNDIPVPRVTEVIGLISEDYLMKWANSLGFKRQNYTAVRDKAAEIGSYVHNYIETYIKTGVFDMNMIPYDILNEVSNGVQSFIEWYEMVKSNNVIEIIGLEEKLIMPYFGGTYDMLIKINDMTYLVDFKTSNHVSYKYFIQTSVYMHMIKELKNIDVDGIIILQLSKTNINTNEYILHVSNPEHKQYLDICLNTFYGLLYSFINKSYLEKTYKNITFM